MASPGESGNPMRVPDKKTSRWHIREMRFLLYPFRWPAKSPRKMHDKSDDAETRALVARLAKGNVLLQSGRYQTEEQLEARAHRMSECRFTDCAND